MLVQLAAIGGAAALLYALIKLHLHVTRTVWTPVFEDERADSSTDEPNPVKE